MELYFPIDEHRNGWSDQVTLDVAVPDRSGSYVVYSGDGSARRVDPDFLPATPTLLLARSEIAYDDLASAIDGGSRTASYLRQFTQDHDFEASVGASFYKGIDNSRKTYLTYIQVTEWHEPPIRGDMEVETFGSINGSYNDCTRITGVEKNEQFYLPPPPNSNRIATAAPTSSTSVFVDIWEDDSGACVLNSSSDDHIGQVNITESQFGTIWGTSNPGDASVRVHATPTVCGDSTCEMDETCANCPADCGPCTVCGNGVCEAGETVSSCPQDCDVICEGSGAYCETDEDCNIGVYRCTCGEGFCMFNECVCPE